MNNNGEKTVSGKGKKPVGLWAPEAFWRLTKRQIDEMCNGCGPDGIGAILVPDTLWGIRITAACNIHDYMYAVGETIDDKARADRVFLNNMVRIIQAESRTRVMKWLRYRRAYKYFEAVNLLGGPYYWAGKNSPDEVRGGEQ